MSKDLVNAPAHYTQGGIQPIDVIKAKLTEEQFIGFLLGLAIAYQLRANFKESFALDISKSQWYTAYLDNYLKEKESKCTQK